MEIVKQIGCSRQYVYAVLKRLNIEILPENKPVADSIVKPKTKTAKQREFEGKDLSMLSDKEKKIVELRLDGKKNREICEELGISINGFSAVMQRIRYKTGIGDIPYHKKHYEKNRDKLKEKQREYYKKKGSGRKVPLKQYESEEKRIHIKEYNKKYYDAHREELLKREKERRDAKKSK